MELTSRKFKGSFDFLRGSNAADRTTAVRKMEAAPTDISSKVDGPVELDMERLLSTMAMRGPAAASDLSKAIDIPLAEMTIALDKLVDDRVIEVASKGATDDENFKRFSLTDIGKRALRYSKMAKF